MPTITPPLNPNLAMVDDEGKPTPFFMRWWQEQADTNSTIVPLTTQEEISEVLDLLGTGWGSVLYRGQTLWTELAASTSGRFLQTNGVDANPSWEAISLSIGDLTDVDDTGATDGQVLTYEVVSGVGSWVPADAAAGGGTTFDGELAGAEVDVTVVAISASSSAYATKGNFYTATGKHQITEVAFNTSTDHDGEVYVAITNGSNVVQSITKKTYTGPLVTGTSGTSRNNVIVLDTPVVVEIGDIVHFGITRTDGVATSSNGVYFNGTPPSGPWTNSGNPSQRTADLDLQVGDTIGGGGYFANWWSVVTTYQPIDRVILPLGGTDGQVLTKQSSDDYDADWETLTFALNDLTDVDTTGLTDGQVLTYEVVSGVGAWVPATPAAATVSAIDDLTDVDTSTAAPTDGQVLTWSAADSEWQPATPSAGGGGGSPSPIVLEERVGRFQAGTSGTLAVTLAADPVADVLVVNLVGQFDNTISAMTYDGVASSSFVVSKIGSFEVAACAVFEGVSGSGAKNVVITTTGGVTYRWAIDVFHLSGADATSIQTDFATSITSAAALSLSATEDGSYSGALCTVSDSAGPTITGDLSTTGAFAATNYEATFWAAGAILSGIDRADGAIAFNATESVGSDDRTHAVQFMIAPPPVSTFKGFRITGDGSTTQAISSSTLTVVTNFNTTVFDTESGFNTTTGEFTVPSSYSGFYMNLFVNIRFLTTEPATLYIQQDTGSGYVTVGQHSQDSSDTYQVNSGPVRVSTGDKFRVRVFLNASSGDVRSDATTVWFAGYVVT